MRRTVGVRRWAARLALILLAGLAGGCTSDPAPRYAESVTPFAAPVSMPQLPFLGRYRHRFERIVQDGTGPERRAVIVADSTVTATAPGQRDIAVEVVEMDDRRFSYGDLGIDFTIDANGGAGNFKTWGVLMPRITVDGQRTLRDRAAFSLLGLRGAWAPAPYRPGDTALRLDAALYTGGLVRGTIDMKLVGASRWQGRAGFLLDIEGDVLLRGERQTFQGYAVLDAGWGLWSHSQILIRDYSGKDVSKQTIERLDVFSRQW